MPLMPPQGAPVQQMAGPPMPTEDEAAGEVVATVYRKPDGTYCTEDPLGGRIEYPDLASAAQGVADMDAGEEQMEAQAAPQPGGGWGSES